MQRHIAYGQWAVGILQLIVTMPKGIAWWISCNALPNCLGALSWGTSCYAPPH